MDSREARQILALYRPGDTDSPDPRMAKALALARQDPQLAAWFGQHCAAHVKIPGEPEGGEASPVTEEPARVEEADREHIIPLNKLALVMIATTALALLGIFLWPRFAPAPKNNFASYRDRMARLVQRSYPMKITATDQAQIREYLRANAGPVNFAMPRNLEKLPGTGGAVFTWHSQPVALLGLDAGANTNLYLFLVKRSAFPDTPIPAKPQFSRVGKLMTASWSEGDNIYVLAGPNDQATLQNYLE